jgi:hypothetical protein
MLVHEVVRLAPLGVILRAAGWDALLQAALGLLSPRRAKQALLAAVLPAAAPPEGVSQLGSGPSLTQVPPEVPGIFAVS